MSGKLAEFLWERVATLSLSYGAPLTYDIYIRRFLVRELPAEALSYSERRAQAKVNVKLLAQNQPRLTLLLSAITSLKKANAVLAKRERALTLIEEKSLPLERAEALTELLRAGLDAHPLYAEVAGARSTRELYEVVKRASEGTKALAS